MRRASVEIVPSPVSGETTYVGFSPNFAGSNYWSIGPGHFRPGSSNPNDYGYWGWDNDAVHNNLATVHGDSLFGWWPYRELLNDTGGLTLTDDQRPWWALDYGNVANYAINQGAGSKRTTGVVGVWHRDPGTNGSDGVGWTPLSGSYSLWCGLRRESDVSQIDPVTGNAYNGTVLANDAIGVGAGGALGGTNVKWPGYGGQWDQLAYRDVDVSSASTIQLRFKYRTNLSTGYSNSAATRTGWFDKDPLSPLAPNNFISASAAGSAAPIDSFMVYVGAPVSTSFVGSDGLAHSVFDPQRRWFSETIRVNEPGIPYRELFTTYGD
ncbi:MAG TPA: hypothetical protein VMJ70_02415, partial [Candidatus Sulfotelmatobacter sp.]|nr:hypothetical protein [Candidatus Sulfotelmatobacter sp.]